MTRTYQPRRPRVTEAIFNQTKMLLARGLSSTEIQQFVPVSSTTISRIRHAEALADYREMVAGTRAHDSAHNPAAALAAPNPSARATGGGDPGLAWAGWAQQMLGVLNGLAMSIDGLRAEMAGQSQRLRERDEQISARIAQLIELWK